MPIMTMVRTGGENHQMPMTGLPNLPAKDNPIDSINQLRHANEGHKDFLVRKKQEWALH
jgi:hypothetical protein